MPPRPSLRSFLAMARGKLAAPVTSRETLTFVVGNESADIDSLCSALVLSYLKSTPPNPHIPLANLPREDLALRSEMTAVLRHAGLHPNDLLTLDDLPPQQQEEPDRTTARWLLVDHNVPAGPLARFISPRVSGCIDHHADENHVPANASPRIIQKAGSCMSLIVNHCRSSWDDLSSDEQEVDVDSQLALIALSAILSDTTALTSKDKTTPHDEEAVAYLEAKLKNRVLLAKNYDRSEHHARIEAVKRDISALSIRDVLRKDYKEWTTQGPSTIRLGICSVVQGLDYLVSKAGDEVAFIAELRCWADEKNLDVVSVMTTLRPREGGGFGRELLVLATNEDAVPALDDFVCEHGEELGLERFGDGRLDGGDREWRRAWTQGNLAASRKQVAPMMRKALGKHSDNKI